MIRNFCLRVLLCFLFLISTRLSFSLDAVAIEGSVLSSEERLASMVIAGIVNRSEPRLYLLNVYETWSYPHTDELWKQEYENEGKVHFTTLYSFVELYERFKSEIKGAILYDPSLTYSNFTGQQFRWQAEVAALLGGFTDCIPLPSDYNKIEIDRSRTVVVKDYFNGQPDIEVTAQLNDPSHSWNTQGLTPEQRYFNCLDWAITNLLPRSNPSKFYLRELTDWTVHQRMFQMNLAGIEELSFASLSDEKAKRIEQVFTFLREKRPGKIFHVYGWMRPEPLVQWISAWGGSFHETLLSNLSWHSIFPVDSDFSYSRPAMEEAKQTVLENKLYLLVVASEGDAGNWVVGFQGGAWQSAMRGLVPVAWGMNLQMLDEFPFIGQYYYRTATSLDGILSVTSPLGYIYPDVLPATHWADAVEKTKRLMDKFHVPSFYGYKHYNGKGVSQYRGVTISNSFDFSRLGAFSEAVGNELTFTFDPMLMTQTAIRSYGGLLFNHVNDDTFYSDVSNLNAYISRTVSKLQNKPRPCFLLAGYQRFREDKTLIGSSNNSDITLQRLKTYMDQVRMDNTIGQYVEFVTPEKFTRLLRLHQDLEPSSIDAEQPNVPTIRVANGNLLLSGFNPGMINIAVADLSGRSLFRCPFLIVDEVHTISLDERCPFKGNYIVSVLADQGTFTQKWIKND